MATIQIPIVNQSGFAAPSYATEGSAGLDLRAAISDEIVLTPMERRLIPTGLKIELPQGYEAQIRPRSGLALKQGITCLNTPGTIDSDYRGEIGVILINLSLDNQVIGPGDRIAQLIVGKYEQVDWLEVPELQTSDRGSGGFGHTGK